MSIFVKTQVTCEAKEREKKKNHSLKKKKKPMLKRHNANLVIDFCVHL